MLSVCAFVRIESVISMSGGGTKMGAMGRCISDANQARAVIRVIASLFLLPVNSTLQLLHFGL